jgi:ABC-type nitrate/sulfonate/bicarbonate transport system permease component
MLPLNSDATLWLTVLALVVILVLLINWIFSRDFLVASTRLAIQRNKELFCSNEGSIHGLALLTLIWLLLWELTCIVFLYDASGSFSAIQGIGEVIFTHNAWQSIFVSLTEIGGGVLFGGLLALTVSTVMHRSEKTQHAIAKILPATFLSPIILWLLVFYFSLRLMDEMSWSRSFVVGIGHKITGVGLLTFFPLIQTSWAYRDAPLLKRWIIAVDDALPMAFIAMLFGELFGATAGLGFQMTVASVTYQYQQSLGYFLITVVLLATSSMILRLIVRMSGVQVGQSLVGYIR